MEVVKARAMVIRTNMTGYRENLFTQTKSEQENPHAEVRPKKDSGGPRNELIAALLRGHSGQVTRQEPQSTSGLLSAERSIPLFTCLENDWVNARFGQKTDGREIDQSDIASRVHPCGHKPRPGFFGSTSTQVGWFDSIMRRAAFAGWDPIFATTVSSPAACGCTVIL